MKAVIRFKSFINFYLINNTIFLKSVIWITENYSIYNYNIWKE